MKILSKENIIHINLNLFEKCIGGWFRSITNPLESILDANTGFLISARKHFNIGMWFPGLIKAGTFLTELGR